MFPGWYYNTCSQTLCNESIGRRQNASATEPENFDMYLTTKLLFLRMEASILNKYSGLCVVVM